VMLPKAIGFLDNTFDMNMVCQSLFVNGFMVESLAS
jgi:hypothetical protein